MESRADLPAQEYHAMDICSSSRLRDLRESPALCRWRMEHGVEETSSMARGTALHAALLEPDKFESDYVIGEHPGNRKPGIAEKKLAAKHGKTLIRMPEYEKVRAMQENAWCHRDAARLLRSACLAELSLFWELEASSGSILHMKSRLDFASEGFVVDVKTTNANNFPERRLRWEIYRRGWHIQASCYMDALDENEYDLDRFAWLVIMNEPPFAVDLREATQATLHAGRFEAQHLATEYLQCQESDQWPQRTAGRLMEIDIPDEALREIYGVEAWEM